MISIKENLTSKNFVAMGHSYVFLVCATLGLLTPSHGYGPISQGPVTIPPPPSENDGLKFLGGTPDYGSISPVPTLSVSSLAVPRYWWQEARNPFAVEGCASGNCQTSVVLHVPSAPQAKASTAPTAVTPYTGPLNLNTPPHPGCAAALKCVPDDYCTIGGYVSDAPVVLTKELYELRVPLTDCQDPASGIVGKCCRDPNYKDPWPLDQDHEQEHGQTDTNLISTDYAYSGAPSSYATPLSSIYVNESPSSTETVIPISQFKPSSSTPKPVGDYGSEDSNSISPYPVDTIPAYGSQPQSPGSVKPPSPTYFPHSPSTTPAPPFSSKPPYSSQATFPPKPSYPPQTAYPTQPTYGSQSTYPTQPTYQPSYPVNPGYPTSSSFFSHPQTTYYPVRPVYTYYPSTYPTYSPTQTGLVPSYKPPQSSSYPGSQKPPYPSQNYPGGSYNPQQSIYPGQQPYPSSPASPQQPGYPGQQPYPSSPASPQQPGYPGQQPYPSSPAPPQQPGYPGQQPYPSSPAPPQQPGYPGQQPYPSSPAPPQQPGYPGQQPYPSSPASSQQPGYPGQQPYPSSPASTQQPGFPGEQPYPSSHEPPKQPNYPSYPGKPEFPSSPAPPQPPSYPGQQPYPSSSEPPLQPGYPTNTPPPSQSYPTSTVPPKHPGYPITLPPQTEKPFPPSSFLPQQPGYPGSGSTVTEKPYPGSTFVPPTYPSSFPPQTEKPYTTSSPKPFPGYPTTGVTQTEYPHPVSSPPPPSTAYPPIGSQQPGYPGSGGLLPSHPGAGSHQPGAPGSQQPGYPGSQQPGYPGSQQPGYPGSQPPSFPSQGSQQPVYPSTEKPGLPGPGSSQPGYPGSQQPGYPGSQQPGYPGSQQPGYPGSQQPGYPGSQQPGFPGVGGVQPGHPGTGGQQPGYPGPVQQPGYPGPIQQPGYPGQHPGHPSQHPGHPGQQPGYPSQQPGYPGQGQQTGYPGPSQPPGYPFPGQQGYPYPGATYFYPYPGQTGVQVFVSEVTSSSTPIPPNSAIYPLSSQQGAILPNSQKPHVSIDPGVTPSLLLKEFIGPCGLRSHDGTPYGEAPWHAIVYSSKNKDLICGGAIVSDSAILTTAHCLDHSESDSTQVKIGPQGKVHHVQAIVRHSKYDRISYNKDLALVLLKEPIKFDSHVGKICLPTATSQPESLDRECYVSTLTKELEPKTLKSVPVKIFSYKDCESKLKNTYLGKYFVLNDSFSCGSTPANDELCTVKTGSPVACDKGDGTYELLGLKSWDLGCQEYKKSAIFTNFDVFWVRSQLGMPITKLIDSEQAYLRSKFHGETLEGIKIEQKPGFDQGYGK